MFLAAFCIGLADTIVDNGDHNDGETVEEAHCEVLIGDGLRTGCPKPFTPIIEVTTTMASAIMMV